MSGGTCQKRVREYLRANPEGATASQIGVALACDVTVVRNSLRSLPESYIDRWTQVPGKGRCYAAVWCVVVPPPDCPHPNGGTRNDR